MPKKKIRVETTAESEMETLKPKEAVKHRTRDHDPGGIYAAPLEDIRSNPWQPRSSPDLVKRAELKVSIRDHGLAQYPVGRAKEGFVEIGDGGERFACYQELRQDLGEMYATMPIILRALSDQDMADLALESNEKRQALNQLDLARFFQRYLEEFKVTQAELAARFGMTQPAISNTIRLLELPEAIKDRIISQEISPTHGRALLQINDSPETQERLVEELVEENIPVAEFTYRVNRVAKEKLRPLDGYYHPHGEPAFDREACENCESVVLPGPGYRGEDREDKNKERFCSNIECWEKKQKSATDKKRESERKRVEKAVGKKGIIVLKDLPYSSYERMDKEVVKICGDPGCENFKHAKYDSRPGSQVEVVCTNPKCLRKKRAADTREKTQHKSNEFTVNMGKIQTALIVPRTKVTFDEDTCQPLLREMVQRLANGDDLKMLCRELGVKPDNAWEGDKAVAQAIERKCCWEIFFLLVRITMRRGYDPTDKWGGKDPAGMRKLIKAMTGEEEGDADKGCAEPGGGGEGEAGATLFEVSDRGEHKAKKAAGKRHRRSSDTTEPGEADSGVPGDGAGEDGSEDHHPGLDGETG